MGLVCAQPRRLHELAPPGANRGRFRLPQDESSVGRDIACARDRLAVGTLVYLIALGLVVALVKAVIAAGANLLSGEATSATHRLRQEMERMRQHLEKKTL